MNSDYTVESIKKIASELEKYVQGNEYYIWYSELTPILPKTINVKLFLEDKISAFQGKQIVFSSVLFLKDAFYSHGNMVKGTLVSDTTSREYERRRHLVSKLKSNKGTDKHPDLLPINKAGFAYSYAMVRKIEVITFGNRYSVYFFGKEEESICRINDITSEELSQIEEILQPHGIEWKLSEFKLPMRDICLFLVLGIVLLTLALLLVVWIFP